MAANPKPLNAFRNRNTQSSIMKPNPNASKASCTDKFELK